MPYSYKFINEERPELRGKYNPKLLNRTRIWSTHANWRIVSQQRRKTGSLPIHQASFPLQNHSQYRWRRPQCQHTLILLSYTL